MKPELSGRNFALMLFSRPEKENSSLNWSWLSWGEKKRGGNSFLFSLIGVYVQTIFFGSPVWT